MCNSIKIFRLAAFLSLFGGILGSPSGAKAQQGLSPLPFIKDSFVVISHRANHVKVPENSIAAINEAVKCGANYVELDLRTTKDGFLVLSHDGSVDRMTDGKGNVKDLTLEEIKQLKLKSPVASDTKIYRVPEFKDVLKVCKKRINIYLDFKDADPQETYNQIKAAGMEKQVVVYLNKADHYKLWKKAAPDMPLMASVPDEIRTPEQLGFFLGQIQIEVLDNVMDSAMLAVTRKAGVAVWLDVEAPDEGPVTWNAALGKNIQGVQTDHPKALIDYLKQNNLRNGPVAFKAANLPAQGYNLPTYRALRDIAYRKDDKDCYLDAYIPAEYENARVIVYIHGGGWTGGDKAEFPKPLLEELVGKRKYIVVSMNYRLVRDGQNLFPAQIEDVKKVLSFLSGNARKYHYEGNEFALMGGSAGGHLAMLYAYGYDSLKQVKTVVDFWGPTDLSDKAVRADNKDADSKVVTLLGVSDPQAQICLDASPYYRITKETGVPTILFHGGEDPLVHVSQAEKMYKKLLSLNIPTQYELYPHDKHGMSPASAVDVFSKTLVWLEKYYPSK
ncbi:glycerophosphodiester phosphodiesterase family protein [Flavitalea flava]